MNQAQAIKSKTTEAAVAMECYEFARITFEGTASTAGYGYISSSLGGGDVVVFARGADESERAPKYRLVQPVKAGGRTEWRNLCSLWEEEGGVLRGTIEPASADYDNAQALLDALAAEDFCGEGLAVLCTEDPEERGIFNLVAHERRRRNFQR
jgi:hypothetical protein